MANWSSGDLVDTSIWSLKENRLFCFIQFVVAHHVGWVIIGNVDEIAMCCYDAGSVCFFYQVAEEYLVECVGNASDEAAAALLGDPKNIDVVKKSEWQFNIDFWGEEESLGQQRTILFFLAWGLFLQIATMTLLWVV